MNKNLQLPDFFPPLDPGIMLVLQIVISAMGVIASILVASKMGEMAATKYSLNETRRRDHALLLIEGPLKNLISQIPHPEQLLSVLGTRGKLHNRRWDLHKGVHPFSVVEHELLLSHLQSGYPEIYKKLKDYEEKSNDLSNHILEAYKRALEYLRETWKLPSVPPTHSGPIPVGFVDYPRTIETVSREVVSVLWHGNELNKAIRDGKVVKLGSHLVADANDSGEAEKIATTLNQLFERPEFIGELRKLCKEAKSLDEERNALEIELKRIETYIRAGMSLKGSCNAGREAGYEK